MNKSSNAKRQTSDSKSRTQNTEYRSQEKNKALCFSPVFCPLSPGSWFFSFTSAVFFLAVALVVWGCGSSGQSTVSGRLIVACADSALPLIQREARTFMTLYEGSHIEVVPTDSRGALVRLFGGEAGVAVVTRDVGDDERKVAAEGGIGLHVYRIAVDGVAIIVNPRNRVDSITVEQVAGLFGGRIASWSEIGGEDRPVAPAVRDRKSGTYELIRLRVLGGADPVRGALCRTSQEVVDRVATDPDGVGCVGLAWLKPGRVKALRVAEKPGGTFVEAEAPSVYKNRYPLRRPFMICATGVPTENSLRSGFISFVTSPRGQLIVEAEGLVPDEVPERTVQLTRENPH